MKENNILGWGLFAPQFKVFDGINSGHRVIIPSGTYDLVLTDGTKLNQTMTFDVETGLYPDNRKEEAKARILSNTNIPTEYRNKCIVVGLIKKH